MELTWRTLTVAERDREYSPSSCLPDGDYRPFVADYRRLSEEAWARVEAAADVETSVVRYGDGASNTIDVAVPSDLDALPPIVVFFHGGYWQELSKADSLFSAWDCVQRGWAFAAVGYPLAPAASVSDIVDECRRGLLALQTEAPALGFDPAQVFVAGSSAGAHLAAMVATDTSPPLRGAILVSGIFELEPLIGTSIDGALSLDPATARQLSPLLANVDGFPPTLLAFGSNETAEFKAQSLTFAQHLDAAGTPTTTIEVGDRNHFDVIGDLAASGTTLGDAVAELIATQGGSHAHL